MIESILQEVGLTKNEIKVYLALLDLGESKTGEILHKSGLNSGKIYEILDSLKRRGLVSVVIRNNVQYFSPAEPQRLFDYLEEERTKLKEKQEDFRKIIPDIMKKINSRKQDAKVEVYYGFQGMKTAYSKEIPRYKKGAISYIFGVTAYKNYEKKVNDFFSNSIMPKREAAKVEARRIFSEDSRNEKGYYQKGAKTKYLPYSSPVSINVMGDLITIGIITEEPLVISIESAEVAKSFIQQFDFLWEIAKK